MAATDPPIADLAGRHDIYGPIHKGLRLQWSDLMARVGATDFDDPAASAATVIALKRGLDLGAKHLSHEEKFLHPALNARTPHASDSIDHQHAHHRQRFAELEGLIAAVEAAKPDTRASLGRRLYLAFSTFVAEDLAHMSEEETVTWPALCKTFSDPELESIESAILASVSPADIMDFLRIMIPAMNRPERGKFLGSMRAAVPAEAFAAVMEQAAKRTLAADDFADLAHRLQLTA